MNRQQAIIALANGERITVDGKDGYFYLYENEIRSNYYEGSYHFEEVFYNKDGYQIYKEPKKKIKKWLWVTKGVVDHYISQQYYLDGVTPDHGVQRLEWSMIEVEEVDE
jgi:hypothetical protein